MERWVQLRHSSPSHRLVVSGGYDCHLLHFDFRRGVLLSRFDLGAFHLAACTNLNDQHILESSQAPDSGGGNISLSPPFITSLAVSSTGVIAAGTADGRLWVGFGGEKSLSAGIKKKKKRRFWEGLKDDSDSFCESVARGPVVGA
jgi:hypothetical protein